MSTKSVFLSEFLVVAFVYFAIIMSHSLTAFIVGFFPYMKRLLPSLN